MVAEFAKSGPVAESPAGPVNGGELDQIGRNPGIGGSHTCFGASGEDDRRDRPTHPALASFDRLMTDFLRERRVPGAAHAVTRNGKLVYACEDFVRDEVLVRFARDFDDPVKSKSLEEGSVRRMFAPPQSRRTE